MPNLGNKKIPNSLLFCFITNNVITCCNSKDKTEQYMRNQKNDMDKNTHMFQADVADGELNFSTSFSTMKIIRKKWGELKRRMCV